MIRSSGGMIGIGLALVMAGCAGLISPAPYVPVSAGAIDIPGLDAQPRLDKVMGTQEWRKAATLDGEFRIATGGLSDGAYPLRLSVGCTRTGLHLGLRIEHAGANPHSNESGAWSDMVLFMFAPGAAGPLTSPSDAYHVWHRHEYGNGAQDGYWDGSAWQLQQNFGFESEFEEGLPRDGRWFRTGLDGPALVFEGFIGPNSTLPEYDGLRLEKGEEFRLALKFVRMRDESPGDAERDIWPGDGFTPNADVDPKDWPVFRYTC